MKLLLRVKLFYINYEECKYGNENQTLYIDSCFILTMRNVNVGEVKQLDTIELGFILTMRNVNSYLLL